MINSAKAMKKYFIFITLLIIQLSRAYAAQLEDGCSSNQSVLKDLCTQTELLDYLFPPLPAQCTPSLIGQQVEMETIKLGPKERKNACRITPVRTAKQFPTLIYEINGNEATLVFIDWQSGLKLLPIVRNGRFLIQGWGSSSPDRVERYLYEWKRQSYRVFRATCLESDPKDPAKSITVKCD